jgi:branched-chain amino acid aminotransferase
MSHIPIYRLTPQGLRPVDYQAASLAEAAHHEPHDGVYTLTNTYQRYQVLKFDAHLDRLEDSAQRENIPLHLDRPALRTALRQMIDEANCGDVRFRITVPRDTPDHLILSVEPFNRPPQGVYQDGVRCITLPHSARHNAAAKTTAWMHDREQHQLPTGIYTGLLLDDDQHILEGMSSNFYAIMNDELRTAGSGVLAGIAQQIVFEIAPPIIPLNRTAIRVSDLPQVAEAFITSSSRGIVPVVEIDGIRLGTGQPGTVTRHLITAYEEWVTRHLEEL